MRDDMEPVVEFLIAIGFTHKQVAATIVEHPPILSYSVTDRLQPFVDCLADVGIDDAARVCSCVLQLQPYFQSDGYLQQK